MGQGELSRKLMKILEVILRVSMRKEELEAQLKKRMIITYTNWQNLFLAKFVQKIAQFCWFFLSFDLLEVATLLQNNLDSGVKRFI
jgi:hypothetical protein